RAACAARPAWRRGAQDEAHAKTARAEMTHGKWLSVSRTHGPARPGNRVAMRAESAIAEKWRAIPGR
ncbi:hypothetical protein, partial [Burkholderia pseudomallei]